MRKSRLFRLLSCGFFFFGVIVLSGCELSAMAQDAASAAPTSPAALPTNPKELLLLTAKTNGLAGDDIKPWHLKVSYTLIDDKSEAGEQKSYEEFWVGDKKFKRIYSSKASTVTEYGTEKGILVSGGETMEEMGEMVRRELLNPLPFLSVVEKNSFVARDVDAGGSKLTCVSFKDGQGNPTGQAWCMEATLSVLRVHAAAGGIQIIRNRILQSQGRYVAGELKFLRDHKPFLTAHVESIEPLANLDEAFFTPPADAVPAKPHKIAISAGVAVGMIQQKIQPVYPAEAKAAGVSGTVVLQATISRDGHIEYLRVVSGPAMLQQAAMDAVRQWTYRPYLLNGEPVEVQTTVNVIFSLGNGPNGMPRMR
jgi:TonB family protein